MKIFQKLIIILVFTVLLTVSPKVAKAENLSAVGAKMETKQQQQEDLREEFENLNQQLEEIKVRMKDTENEITELETLYKKEFDKVVTSGNLEGLSLAEKQKVVVAYATKFVGNPYVWGGTDLNNGIDCSGFTMKIYEHFGYKLPHFSGAQAFCGKSVSFGKIEIGDIVVYAGHVGIYVGNNKLLSAKCKKLGITYCDVNYKPILTIRRILK